MPALLQSFDNSLSKAHLSSLHKKSTLSPVCTLAFYKALAAFPKLAYNHRKGEFNAQNLEKHINLAEFIPNSAYWACLFYRYCDGVTP